MQNSVWNGIPICNHGIIRHKYQQQFLCQSKNNFPAIDADFLSNTHVYLNNIGWWSRIPGTDWKISTTAWIAMYWIGLPLYLFHLWQKKCETDWQYSDWPKKPNQNLLGLQLQSCIHHYYHIIHIMNRPSGLYCYATVDFLPFISKLAVKMLCYHCPHLINSKTTTQRLCFLSIVVTKISIIQIIVSCIDYEYESSCLQQSWRTLPMKPRDQESHQIWNSCGGCFQVITACWC